MGRQFHCKIAHSVCMDTKNSKIRAPILKKHETHIHTVLVRSPWRHGMAEIEPPTSIFKMMPLKDIVQIAITISFFFLSGLFVLILIQELCCFISYAVERQPCKQAVTQLRGPENSQNVAYVLSEEFPTDILTYLKGQPKLGEWLTISRNRWLKIGRN